MNYSNLESLLLKYLEASSSPEEKIWLMEYFSSEENKKMLTDFIENELESAKDFEAGNEEKYDLERIFKKIMTAIHAGNHK